MSERTVSQRKSPSTASQAEAVEELTVGRALHSTRRRRRISMDRAAGETRIRRDYLVAMEKDDFGFQAPAYVKGLLANYARFLRLDPAPLLSELEGGPGSGGDEARALAEKSAAWTGVLSMPSARLPLVVTAIALALLTTLALWTKSNDRPSIAPRQDTGVTEQEAQLVPEP